MKKIGFIISLAILLGLCFTGCSNTMTNTGDVVYKPSRKIEYIQYKDQAPSTIEYSYTYDSVGNLLKEESSTGNRIDYTYDSNGKLIKSVSKNPSLGISEEVTEYSYNNSGLLVEKTYGTVKVTYTYDRNENCTKEEYFLNGGDVASQIYKYTYNSNDDVIKRIMEFSNDTETTEYAYDDNGRVTSSTMTYISAFGGVTVGNSTYTYDEYGNLLKIHFSTTSSEGSGALLSKECITEYQDYKPYSLSN